MINIKSSADMARVLASSIDADLERLLTERRDQLMEHNGDYDLGDLAHFIVAQPGDSLADIEGAAGVALATNFMDDTRQGEPGFVHPFEFVQGHEGGWFEAVVILSDDGFGVAIIVPDRPGIDPDLLSLVRDRD